MRGRRTRKNPKVSTKLQQAANALLKGEVSTSSDQDTVASNQKRTLSRKRSRMRDYEEDSLEEETIFDVFGDQPSFSNQDDPNRPTALEALFGEDGDQDMLDEYSTYREESDFLTEDEIRREKEEDYDDSEEEELSEETQRALQGDFDDTYGEYFHLRKPKDNPVSLANPYVLAGAVALIGTATWWFMNRNK
jgi:hypothetical protein